MRRHGVTQRQLAAAMGIAVQNLNGHIHCRKTPGVAVALRYVAALQTLTGKGFEVGDIWELK